MLVKQISLKDLSRPDYLVEGVLQRRFIYSLTGVTGGGKTALALLLTRAVGSVDPTAAFGGHSVDKGKVVYFVGENPDDVRARVIGANAKRDDDASSDRVSYVVGVFDIKQMRDRLVIEAERPGGVDLVIVDTSAAYFLQEDENSNSQMGEHARMLRSLTELPGGPCVLALCHPIKNATEPSQLVPRGGGAFLAAIDGNLTAWRHEDDLIEFHHSALKFRGPGFEPIAFRIEKITTTKLVDSKGRLLPTVRAVHISEEEEAARAQTVRADEDRLLLALLEDADRSWSDLARACGWLLPDGEPYKSKVKRTADRLVTARLIKPGRSNGRWVLTKEGREAAQKLKKDDDIVEERGGASGSTKPFYALRGNKQRATVPCMYCGLIGDVWKYVDGRVSKERRHYADLHEGCTEDYFTGKPRPGNGSQRPADASTANGGVPFMLTAAQKRELRALGYTDEQIREMKPERGHDILAQKRKPDDDNDDPFL